MYHCSAMALSMGSPAAWSTSSPLPHWPWYSCCIFFPSASTMFSDLNAYSQRCHHLSCWAHGCIGDLEPDVTSISQKPPLLPLPKTLIPAPNAMLKDRKTFTAKNAQNKICSSVSFWLLQKRSPSLGEEKLTWHMKKQQPHKFPKKPCVNNIRVRIFHLEKI